MGFGTQTHASTIRPAGYCGAYALKARHGALHVGGVAPLGATLDHLGLIGTSLEDVWATAMVISRTVGGTPPDAGIEGPMEAPAARKPKRLVRLATLGWHETPDLSRVAFAAAVEAIAATGVEIIEAEGDGEVAALEAALRDIGEFANDLLAWKSRSPLESYRQHGDAMVGARIQDLLARAATMDAARYQRALADRERLRGRVAAWRHAPTGS